VDEALSQIEEKKYFEKYRIYKDYRIFKVGINIGGKSVVDVKIVEESVQL
jgi:hypothetical protein